MRIIGLIELGTDDSMWFKLGNCVAPFFDTRPIITNIELSPDSNWYAVELDNGHRLNFDDVADYRQGA